MKETGILLPVSSLPSRTGVGELGSFAYEWLDLLFDAGMTIWQILPLNPAGYGNSPYQPYSSFAGDEIYISLDQLYEEGLLKVRPQEFGMTEEKVSFESVRAFKEPYLREAYSNFTPDDSYAEFKALDWVNTYSIFRAAKQANDGTCWIEWEEDLKCWPENKKAEIKEYEQEAEYHVFLQFIFYRQWEKLHTLAAEKGIKIMGDVPFYVGIDSADVWGEKKNFLLGADGKPTFIAGVPPDYFSATGQRWGNPIYDWEYLKKNNYKFWTERIGYSQKLFDIIRIDHFRAFDTYWKIPASCPTAIDGEWIEAPGYEVIDKMLEEIPGLSLVAEDLGMLRKEVTELKDHYHFKGMKIIEFTINTDGKYAFDDFCDTDNMIIYTGTHDNATLKEWYESFSPARKRKIRRWLARKGLKQGSVNERLIRYVLESRADYAVIAASDIIEKGAEARLNTPGTVGSPNWEWKLSDYGEMKKKLGRYKRAIEKRKQKGSAAIPLKGAGDGVSGSRS